MFAADELTGFDLGSCIDASIKSTKDMELKSLKRNTRVKGFAAGCSRRCDRARSLATDGILDKLLTNAGTKQPKMRSIRK